jgi:AcrR family transcriptional regulator
VVDKTEAEAPSLRDRALDAAARLFAENGPDGLSMRKVAAAAHCSTMVIYHHFGDKDGLLNAMYIAGFERLARAQAAVPAVADPEQLVRARYLNYRDVALESPAFYQVMFGAGAPLFRPDAHARQFARDAYNQFVAAVTVWSQTCELTTTPRAAAYTLWAAAHGLVSFELSRHGPGAGYKRRYVAALDTLIRGLRTGATAGAVEETNSATASAKSSAWR